MFKRVICLLLLLFVLPCQGALWMVWNNAAVAPSFLFREKFEGSNLDSNSVNGFDNTGWVGGTTPVVAHYNTAPAPLQGSFSLQAVNALNSGERHNMVADQSTACFYFIVRFVSASFGGYNFIARSAGAADLFSLTTGGPGITVTCGTQAVNVAYSTGVTYYVWCEYTANSKTLIYVSTTATKPGSPSGDTSTGGGTPTNAAVHDYVLYGEGGAIFDDVIENGVTPIGSNP